MAVFESIIPPDADVIQDRRWTPEQWLGITTTGGSLLVSAAAGSGKTAVLAERCAYLICDADPPCEVDELLVVTYTEAAAAEMKTRIQQALRKRLARGDSPRLVRQSALVDRARVSTLHGFCARLLRQHFHLVGLDPNFTILDGQEAGLLRAEIAREVFADRYEKDESGDFQRLIDWYGDGNDEQIMRHVIRAHEMPASLVDPAGWRQTARRRIAEAAQHPLESSELGRELIEIVLAGLRSLYQRCGQAIAALKLLDGFEKYVGQLEELLAVVRHWGITLREHGFDALTEVVRDFEMPPLPRLPNSIANKELARGMIDAIRDEMKKGALLDSLRFSAQEWREGLRQTLPNARMFLSLVEEFSSRYQEAKLAARSVDFSDLEQLALKVLRDENSEELAPSAVAKLHHRQIKHVLVDEYQDINEVQDAILNLVSRECVSGRRGVASNLFCVGDVKQSIYRFRLAEPRRFLERQHRFKQSENGIGKVIDLQANFRGRAPLLDAINAVFERLMTAEAADIQYDQSHRLQPGLEYPKNDEANCFAGVPIKLHLLPMKIQPSEEAEEDGSDEVELDRTGREATLVAGRIREMMGSDGRRPMQVMEKDAAGVLMPRPIEFRDIVVLLRSMQFKAEQFADILHRGGIPVHSDRGRGYFDSMEVRDMLALLGVLENQKQDVSLAAVLRSPLAGLAKAEDCLARIRLAYNDPAEPVAFHEAAVRYAREQDDELSARLRDFFHDLAGWRELAQRRPLAELIWTIYDRTGYLAFCSGLEDGEQRSANLIALHERARQFGTFHRQGLARFIQFLQSLEEESAQGQAPVAGEADNVVRIMSIHGSKGLEFPVVFIPDLAKKINLKDCQGPILMDRHAYLGLSVVDESRRIRYPSLASMLVANRLRQQSLAEELRVLYVAMTRAKEHLILSATCADHAPQKWEGLWSKHAGPLPANVVQGGKSMLDWVGPAAAAMAQNAGGDETQNGDEDRARVGGSARAGGSSRFIQIIQHSVEEVDAWPTPEQFRSPLNPEQAHLAELLPLMPAPGFDAQADELIQRLTWAYPYSSFSSLAAAQSATGWTKHGRLAPAGYDNSERPGIEFDALLPSPRCLSETLSSSAADIGTDTHLFLQYLDFARPCTPEALAGQLDELVDRKLITSSQAKSVHLPAILWLMETEIGRLLRENAAKARREVPFYFAAPPELFKGGSASQDPMDQVMIRGRIDLVIPLEEGAVLIDYKTDRVTEATAAARAEFYAPQMSLYRDAIEKAMRIRVSGIHLIFLAPRLVWTF